MSNTLAILSAWTDALSNSPLTFARGLADSDAIMNRCEIVSAGTAESLDQPDVRRNLMP